MYIWLGNFYCLFDFPHHSPVHFQQEVCLLLPGPVEYCITSHLRSPEKNCCVPLLSDLEKKQAFVPMRGLSFNLEIVVKMENNTEQKQWSQLKDHHSKSLGKGSL